MTGLIKLNLSSNLVTINYTAWTIFAEEIKGVAPKTANTCFVIYNGQTYVCDQSNVDLMGYLGWKVKNNLINGT